MPQSVVRLKDIDSTSLSSLLERYSLKLRVVEDENIPGSFWGDEEAGLIGNKLFARLDTPIHSILHESCHYICMDANRRKNLDTDAAGDYDEENAVCYLQILLAQDIDGMDSQQMMQDMDAWGYSFRLGSTRAWFEQDAEDALHWLQGFKLVEQQRPTYQLRM